MPPLRNDGIIVECNLAVDISNTNHESLYNTDEAFIIDYNDLLDVSRRKRLCRLINGMSKCEKILIACCSLLMLTTIILFSFLLLKSSANQQKVDNSTGKDNKVICDTEDCVYAASELLNSIDFSKDPCDDFSLYACGKWAENNRIPDDFPYYTPAVKLQDTVWQQMKPLLEANNSVDDALPLKMIRNLYGSCMDTSTLNNLKSGQLQYVLNILGGWPMVQQLWQQKFDLTYIIGNIMKYYGINTLLSLSFKSNIPLIQQGKLAIDSKGYFLNETLYRNELVAYKKYILDTINLLASDMNLHLFKKILEKHIGNMISFEKELAYITIGEEQRNNISNYKLFTAQNISLLMAHIDFTQLLRIVAPDDIYKKLTNNNSNYPIIVGQGDYFDKLDNLLMRTDQRIVINYILWIFVKSYSPYLDDRFTDTAQEFSKVSTGRAQKYDRWKYCVVQSIKSLSLASGALYAKQYFHAADKTDALKMIKNLKASFSETLTQSDWMDERTKLAALDKLNNMVDYIGYPDFVMNKTQLEEYYSMEFNETKNSKTAEAYQIQLTYWEAESYFTMSAKTNAWLFYKDYYNSKITVEFNAADVNAYYTILNFIVYPVAVFQPPFYKGSFPKAFNYGAFGSVIGHEMTHGFDDNGSQRDKTGNFYKWWSQSAYEKFMTKTKCIIEQYGNYSFPGIEQKVNGMLTLGENIADNGGVKHSFKAYKKYLNDFGQSEPTLPGINATNEQLFFLSYAHIIIPIPCPSGFEKIRARGPYLKKYIILMHGADHYYSPIRNWWPRVYSKTFLNVLQIDEELNKFYCGNFKKELLVKKLLVDTHSPEKFRINGPLSNFEDFALMFKCKPGTNMNPVKKCSVW